MKLGLCIGNSSNSIHQSRSVSRVIIPHGDKEDPDWKRKCIKMQWKEVSV